MCRSKTKRNKYLRRHRQQPEVKAAIREQTRAWRHRTKIAIIGALGGKCSRCGFNEHIFGLQFDHKDPSVKRHEPARLIGSVARHKSIEYVVRHCNLLCANCHALKTVAYADCKRGNVSDTSAEKALFEANLNKQYT